jgi:hypothetical protein
VFLFFFFFFLCPFCILPVCLGAPFTLFNNILFITYQKKKNSRTKKGQSRGSLLFFSLLSWTAAFLAPLVIRFNDFLLLFSSSS